MVLAALGALVLAQFGDSSNPRRVFAAGEKDVFMMLPPETVCGSDVGEMTWTADGSHLAVLRGVVDLSAADVALAMGGSTRPSPEAMQRLRPRYELVVWSVRTRKAQTVLTADPLRLSITDLSPLPSSDRLVVETIANSTGADGEPTQTQRVSLLSAATGTFVDLGTAANGQLLSVQVAEGRPLAAVVRHDLRTHAATARLFGAAGVLGPTIAIPARGQFMFDRTGRPGYLAFVPQPSGKRQAQLHTIDPASGREVSVAAFVPAPEPKTPPAPTSLRVVTGRSEDAVAPSIFLAVEGGKPGEAGVVTTDGTRGLLSPKGDAIAYVSQGSAMVRRFARIDRKAYEAARLAAEKMVAISNAKQAALAMLIYAADMDDALPGQDVDIRSKIGPYIKNDAILSGFTYTFAGGKMTDIARPAETEIGYTPGPGGRAVAYADGHVVWVPDAP